MPRLTKSDPKYRRRKTKKGTVVAVVTLNGRDHYLGLHGTPESRQKYHRTVAEWNAGGRQPLDTSELAVSQVVLAYWRHVKAYYLKPDGTPTSERDTIKQALKPLKRLFGPTPARSFGPRALKTVREAMVAKGWCRKHVNKQVGRLRQMFKWATEEELIDPTVYHGLQAVAPLKIGRGTAPESAPVLPVAEEAVRAVLPHVSAQVRGMIEVQLLTGMRPGEVCQMRSGDLDRTGNVWTYKPGTHKAAHHGHERIVYLGPKAQAVLAPFLKPEPGAFVFSPADAEDARRRVRHLARTTAESCGNGPGSNRRTSPKRQPGECYDVASYRRAIARACEKAFPLLPDLTAGGDPAGARAKVKAWRKGHRWHPHQLRHTAGTRLRREYGLEAAQVILGHKNLTVTQVYAEKNVVAARQIMSKAG